MNLSGKSKAVLPVVIIASIWLLLASADWVLRMRHFRWHERLIRKPASPETLVRGPEEPMQRRVVAAYTGGDLTRLIADEEVIALYGEMKPETVIVTDEAGYRNLPPTDGQRFPVLMTGDSFMHVQYGEQGSYADQLRTALKVPVYNHAYPGAGAFWGLHRYLLEGRFADRPPAVIVWGVLEREVAGGLFSGYVYHTRKWKRAASSPEPALTPGTFAWEQIKPAALQKSLPDTSYISAFVNHVWNSTRYRLFGVITEDVIVSQPDQTGRPFLMYYYNLDAMTWTPEERDIPQAGYAVEFIRDTLREMGSELVVLLIPDKEQVYYELIPDDVEVVQPYAMSAFEQELRRRDVPVVNLEPVFRKLTAAGEVLYWRDDTHWKPQAMTIAAEMTAELIRERGMLGTRGETPDAEVRPAATNM